VADREGRGGAMLEVAADEAVGGRAALQGGRTGLIDDGGAVGASRGRGRRGPSGPGSPSRPWLASHSAPTRAGARGPDEEGERGRRRAGRLIGGRDGIAARALGPALAEELPRGRVEQADLAAVPLDGDLTANLPGRGGVVGPDDLDAPSRWTVRVPQRW
jgi:hypothetical protein